MPDLVVRYVPGPETMNPVVGYAAVMKAAADLDDVYADAEPPTHDAWIDSQLAGERATFNASRTRVCVNSWMGSLAPVAER